MMLSVNHLRISIVKQCSLIINMYTKTSLQNHSNKVNTVSKPGIGLIHTPKATVNILR